MEIQNYLKKINDKYILGNTTEHSFRGELQELIESLFPKLIATNEPKRIKCGAPDYVVTKRKENIPIGYIEAKDIGIKLSSKSLKEQFERYKSSLDNLIITDYLTFEFYKKEDLLITISIAKVENGKIVPIEKNFIMFKDQLKEFCNYEGQTIKNPRDLAILMADKARMLQYIIENAIVEDNENQENTTLIDQMKAFKELLIHDITPKQFSDIYAQTIAYGMFAARLEDTTLDTFTRQEAAELIPKTNPFLRKLFQYIAGYDLDERIIWIVDSLADIFRAADINEILKDFGREKKMQDPIIHFYEDFLNEYDPKLRKNRGVWYTPQPIVNFIVKAVDEILKKDFNKESGIACYDTTKIKVNQQGHKAEKVVHKIQILDPATGTGTFLAETLNFIYEEYFKNNKSMWSSYVEEHLLPRLHGFELLMTSYAMAHIKLEMLLKETGYNPKKNKRIGVYLTNSLEEHHPDMATLFASWLSQEANEANYIKRDTPVMCILGNPPYNGESFNKGTWIMDLMKDYKMEPGGKEKLKEKNPKWLNDDYVKFIRYAQSCIDKNKEGVVAFINPHGFLDNTTFRGMRWKLLKSFDKIYVIDLHGNAKKKEVTPNGEIDQNVFDIQQGVSINIFIKTGKKNNNQLAEVFHYDLYGKREEKFDFLNNNKLENINFKKVENIGPEYYMVPINFELKKEYDKGFSLDDLFITKSIGIVTGKDKILINTDKETLKKNIKEYYGEEDETFIKEISYRPFDNRYIYYDCSKLERAREKNMKNLVDKDNLSLIYRRQQPESKDLYIFSSKFIVADGFIRSDNKGGETIAPLYTYTNIENDKFAFLNKNNKVSNLNSEIVEKILKIIKENTSENIELIIFDYIYGLLHTPSYRNLYASYLKIDYPKIRYPKNKDEFYKYANLGRELREIHTLFKNNYETNINFPVCGDNKVEKPVYKNEKIYINEYQYFENVSLDTWNCYIGGYQPAQKWLKDRKGEELKYDDIKIYSNLCHILKETLVIMKRLDEI